MTTVVERAAKTEITLEPFIEVDTESRPTYGGPYVILGRVTREDQVIKSADGTEIRTQFKVWVSASQDPLPRWHDRLTFETLGEPHTTIAEFYREGRSLRGKLSHVKVMCREE